MRARQPPSLSPRASWRPPSLGPSRPRSRRRPRSVSRSTPARSGAPISPLVYGQFIEHLGRCIYGGLWAEMLEDRKFFYPVTGDAPAWELITPGKTSLGR